uniref:Uncharacterized protein n=1 Tax=mine drainage metagenome TaxID=410659 RepID=E6QB79_9ZZZZ
MHMRMRGVVVVDSRPLHRFAELRFNPVHEYAGILFQIQIGSVFRRQNDLEQVRITCLLPLIQTGVQGNLILSRIKSFPFFAFLLSTFTFRIFSVGLPLTWLFIRDISHLNHRAPLRALVSRSFGHGFYRIMIADPWKMKANLRHRSA